MTEGDKQTLRSLTLGVIVAVSGVGFMRWRAHRAWSGPLMRVEGKVLSCESGYSASRRRSSGMWYRTRYEYTDASGRPRQADTESLRHCAAPGTPLVIEWPEGHPESAVAREK